jgi:hypothetical protein
MPKITSVNLRRGTTTAWTTANPILADGEIGWDSTAGKFKVGNGTSTWSALAYVLDSALAGKANSSHTHAATDLASGTIPDARLPARLGPTANPITDWNLATTNGWYMQSNALNAPATGWFIGFVEAHNALWITQTVHAFTGDASTNTNVWRRSGNDSGGVLTWQPWYKLQLSQAEQDARYPLISSKGAANGIASLDSGGKLPYSQLPPLNPSNVIYTLEGLYSARPIPSSVSVGAVYYATDVDEQYRSNGTSWSVVGNGGNERGSASITAMQSTDHGIAGPEDITGMTTTFVAGERPVRIVVDCDLTNSTATNVTTVQILLNDVQVGYIQSVASASTDVWQSYSKGIRAAGLTPGATYTARCRIYVTGGWGRIGGATDNPSTISVINL